MNGRPRLSPGQGLALDALLRREAVQKIFAALDHPGEETRVVGGAVRDALYGRAVREIDLAATAPPRATLERAAAAGLRALPTGFAHGTVTILVDGESFEVTTLREDVETDGRRARVRFGRDFAADAARRDFTINALSLSRDGALHDYVGGLDDAAARRVRFIGDPDRRIAEDFLRILRFFRFSADYADTIDAAGFWACARQRAGVERLSRERLRAELMKTLHSRRAAPALAAMGETGALGAILGGVVNPARLARLIESAPDACALLRLAALALDAQEDAARLAARLRLSNAERDRLARAGAALAVFHARRGIDEAFLRRALFLHGREAARDAAALAFAGEAARAYLAEAPEPVFPASGAALVAKGLSGRAVGAALARLRARWMAAGFPADAALIEGWIAEEARAR